MAKKKPEKRSAIQALDDARAAIEKDDLASAAALLAEAWGSAPTKEIEDALLRVDAKLPRVPFEGKTVAAREEAWLALAERADSRDVPSLLALDWPVHPRGAKARFKLLKKFPADPRIARSILDAFAAKRWLSNAGNVFWGWAFKLLADWKHHELRGIADKARREQQYVWYWIERTIPPTFETHALDDFEAKALAAVNAVIDKHLGAKKIDRTATREALLAAIYANPDDDGPRLVYADFLVEEGDPRGEFIQLDVRHAHEPLKGKALARRNALLREAKGRWLDGLADLVWMERVVFRRGFLARVNFTRPFDPAHAALATLEVIGTNAREMNPEMVLHPNLRALRSVHSVDGKFVAALAARATRPFDELAFYAAIPPIPRLGEGFALRSARAHDLPGLRSILSTAIAALVGNVALNVTPQAAHIQWAIAAGQEAPANVATIEIAATALGEPYGWRLVLRRDDGGAFTRAEAAYHGGGASKDLALVEAFDRLPSFPFTSFALNEKEGEEIPEAVRGRLAGYLR